MPANTLAMSDDDFVRFMGNRSLLSHWTHHSGDSEHFHRCIKGALKIVAFTASKQIRDCLTNAIRNVPSHTGVYSSRSGLSGGVPRNIDRNESVDPRAWTQTGMVEKAQTFRVKAEAVDVVEPDIRNAVGYVFHLAIHLEALEIFENQAPKRWYRPAPKTLEQITNRLLHRYGIQNV